MANQFDASLALHISPPPPPPTPLPPSGSGSGSPPPPLSWGMYAVMGSGSGSDSDPELDAKETKEIKDHKSLAGTTAIRKELKEQGGGARILIVIDVSGSMKHHHPYKPTSVALSMLKKTCPSAMIEISTFTERTNFEVKRPMQVVADCERLTRADYIIGGGTHVYDVVRRHHNNIVNNNMLKDGPVSLMLLTDGEDMGSETTQEVAHGLVADLKRRGVYCTAIVPVELRATIIAKLGFDEDKVIVFESSNVVSLESAMFSGSSGMSSHSSGGHTTPPASLGASHSSGMPLISALHLDSASSHSSS